MPTRKYNVLGTVQYLGHRYYAVGYSPPERALRLVDRESTVDFWVDEKQVKWLVRHKLPRSVTRAELREELKGGEADGEGS